MDVAKKFREILSVISPKLNTRVCYLVKFKKRLDLKNPKTLNEKILWLKFNTYWNNELVKQCADKYKVRDYIDKKNLSCLLPNLLDVYENPENIDWNSLPEKFAIKLNVGCGKNIIVNKKENLDINETISTLNEWMKDEYWKGYSEMQYKDVKPYILIEEYLGGPNGEPPLDYKFYCMNGKASYVMVCDREDQNNVKYFYFDREWNMMPFTKDAINYPNTYVKKPINIKDAFDVAELLSKDFPFVRTDLYITNDKIYFGELTFTPSAGMDHARMYETDLYLGNLLVLN